jgi:2-dehydropantoate 2-reductase
MRIAVMGSGGIGGFCGAKLAAKGADVLFIARGEHLKAMRSSGLRLLSALGDINLKEVNATDNPAGHSLADLVLFTVKGPDTDSAMELITPIVGQQTGIICFQNGVDGIDKLAARYGKAAVLPGAAVTNAIIGSPGIIRHVGQSNSFTFGEWNGELSTRASAYRDLAQMAGINTQLSTTPLVDVWAKYVRAAAGMSVTCLSRLPLRACIETPETRELLVEAMREGISLARGRGIEVPRDTIDRMLAVGAALDPSWKTSMLTDLEAGKVIEAESIFGAAHRMGRKLGQPTPVLSVAYRALKHYTRPQA